MKLNNIKDKFEDREIQPSPASWEKLSQRLDHNDKKSKKPVLLWLVAAAAVLVLGLTVVPSLFTTTQVTPIDNHMVVETPEVESPEAKETEEEPDQQKIPEVYKEKEAIATADKTKKATQKTNVTKTASLKINQDIALAQPQGEISNSSDLQTGVAQVEKVDLKMETATGPETPFNEADALLNQALKNVQVREATATTINPNKLLRETEWDIQAEKHNRLENTLLDGLGRLKREAVALIDRN